MKEKAIQHLAGLIRQVVLAGIIFPSQVREDKLVFNLSSPHRSLGYHSNFYFKKACYVDFFFSKMCDISGFVDFVLACEVWASVSWWYTCPPRKRSELNSEKKL